MGKSIRKNVEEGHPKNDGGIRLKINHIKHSLTRDRRKRRYTNVQLNNLNDSSLFLEHRIPRCVFDNNRRTTIQKQKHMSKISFINSIRQNTLRTLKKLKPGFETARG